MIQFDNPPPKKFGAEETFGSVGPTKNWWISQMQLSFPEPPEKRFIDGLQLAQSSATSSQASPQQASGAAILLATGLWGILSETFKHFNEEKQRMEMEISELKTRLTRLEFKKEDSNA